MILTHPAMWGGAQAVEMQILLLMEILALLNLPRSEDFSRPRMWLMEKYRNYIQENVHQVSPYMISGAIIDIEIVARHLGQFYQVLKRELEEMKKAS